MTTTLSITERLQAARVEMDSIRAKVQQVRIDAEDGPKSGQQLARVASRIEGLLRAAAAIGDLAETECAAFGAVFWRQPR